MGLQCSWHSVDTRETGRLTVCKWGGPNCSAPAPASALWCAFMGKKMCTVLGPTPVCRPLFLLFGSCSFHLPGKAFGLMAPSEPFRTVPESVGFFFRQLLWPQKGDWLGEGDTGNSRIFFSLFSQHRAFHLCCGVTRTCVKLFPSSARHSPLDTNWVSYTSNQCSPDTVYLELISHPTA